VTFLSAQQKKFPCRENARATAETSGKLARNLENLIIRVAGARAKSTLTPPGCLKADETGGTAFECFIFPHVFRALSV
jgi:hypothetical protein